jgi:O-antigen ligase
VADDRGSAYSRITRAREAIAVIGDYPLLGVGLNNYALSVPRYDRDTTASWRTPPMVHNVYLLVAAETGLVGLAALAWFLTALGVQAWQFLGLAEGRTLWALAVSSVLAFVTLGLHGLVDYDLLGDVGLFRQFWLLAAVVAGFSSRPGYQTNGVRKPREWVHGTSQEVRSGAVNLPVGGGNDAFD